MSNYRKNLMVGLTMFLALVLLGYMLIKFGSAPAKWFTPAKMTIELRGATAEGISPGSNVTYLGVSIGQVLEVHRTDDNNEIVMTAGIDEKNPPPENVIGHIKTPYVGNGSTISLELPGGEKPQGRIKAGSVVQTLFLGNSLIPPEFAMLAEEVHKAELVNHLNKAVLATTTQIEHVGKLVDSLDATLNDPEMRTDLKTALANVRVASTDLSKFSGNLDKLSTKMSTITDDASDTLHKTQGHIDNVAKQVDDRMAQVSKLLESFQSITAKIDQGKGTAGMLINDAKLYDSLVSTSRELNLTITDIKHLVEQWEQEGAYIKLNK